MHARSWRRFGATLTTLGLVLTTLVFITGSSPAGAAADTSGLVCNNQKDRPDQDCEGDNEHGTVSAAFDGSGNLTFTIASTTATEWKQIYICIPGSPRTNSADCQGNSPTLIEPAGNYTVTTAGTETVEDKSVSFDCTKNITATVDADVVAQYNPVTWTIHVNTCDGGTDEAFGSTGRTPPPDGADPTYNCVAPTNVTTTSATLNGSTDDPDVTKATFTFTSGTTGSLTGVSGGGGAYSAAATGLSPGTAYVYKVDFLTATDTIEGTASNCAFGTQATPDTYECEAPTDVSATGATVRARTTNGEVDTVSFALTPSGTVGASTETGSSGRWSASAGDLAPSTRYTYVATFRDGADVTGTASGDVCAFTTAAAVSPSNQQNDPPPPAQVAPVAPTGDVRPAVAAVAGVVQVQPPTAAPAARASGTAPAVLARTGVESMPLLVLGLLLVLLGVVVTQTVGRRPELAFVEAPSSSTAARPELKAELRPLLILGGLLAAGSVLGRSGRR